MTHSSLVGELRLPILVGVEPGEFGSFMVLERWSFGALEFWSVGVLERWSFIVWSVGVLEFGGVGVWEFCYIIPIHRIKIANT